MGNVTHTTVRVEGARELRATMRKAGLDMSDLKAAHKAAAGIVVSGARPPYRSGALSRSTRTGATQTRASVMAGRARTVPYANPIHWGWFSRHIKATPWLSIAAQQTEPLWTETYRAAVAAIIDKIKGA